MDVIEFPIGRTPGPRPGVSQEDVAPETSPCRCGSHWFHLVDRGLDGSTQPPAVVVATDGRITGYTGALYCVDCGQPKNP